MSDLSLNELLESAGITKAQLADLMGVSRKTITRMGDDVTPEVQAVVSKHEAPAQIWEITHRSIALSRIKYGREGMAIDDVAKLFGLSVFEYNREVNRTIRHCHEEGTSFAELRS